MILLIRNGSLVSFLSLATLASSLFVLATGLYWDSTQAFLVVAVLCFGLGTSLMGGRLPFLFLKLLGAVLIGYALMGRGFAYLGYPPVFVGELTLLVGLIALTRAIPGMPILRFSVSKLLVLFAVWGAICTVPHIMGNGIQAFRDAVIWGYSSFAILVFVFSVRYGLVQKIVNRYAQFVPWFLMLAPATLAIHYLAGEYLPQAPGSEVALIHPKPGDLAVHLSGAGVFLLAGGYQHFDNKSNKLSVLKEWLLVALWVTSTIVVCSISRSALLAMMCSMGLAFAFRPSSRWCKLAATSILLLSLLLLINIQLNLSETERTTSPQQILANLESIVGISEDPSLEGTRRWRLEWWRKVTDYTFYGDYFWTGKGYGINLADDDGFQVTADSSLRSPHNAHITILARSGVPGLLIWLILQITFATALIRTYYLNLRRGLQSLAIVTLWIFVYWTAFFVNGSFDVFLEGPQGGIWFWSIFGIGMGVITVSRRPREDNLPPAQNE